MRSHPRSPLLAAFIVAAALAAGACAADPLPQRQPARRAADKAALYGDAALLPTRAGERARQEVALAEEIRVAVETLHAVERAHVTVATGPHGAASSAAVVIRARQHPDAEGLSTAATRIARAALGSQELQVEVQVSAPDTADASAERPDAPQPPTAALLFGVLGLGISLGLTFDRTAGIIRRRRPR